MTSSDPHRVYDIDVVRRKLLWLGAVQFILFNFGGLLDNTGVSRMMYTEF
jgi:hypothetical protein